MVGSSQSLGLPNTVLNTIAAEYLMRIADRLEGAADAERAWRDMMSEMVKDHSRVIFNGNNYTPEWATEAERRGLPNISTTVDAILVTQDPAVCDVFKRHGVFTDTELSARMEIALTNYATAGRIEATTMLKIARQSIMPAVVRYACELTDTCAKSVACGVDAPAQTAMLKEVNTLLEGCRQATDTLDKTLHALPENATNLDCAKAFRDTVKPCMERLRAAADGLERVVGKDHWPMPSYGEMLFKIERLER